MSHFQRFASRRSVVYSKGGMVACTQPLAVEAGQRILALGGNAAVSRSWETREQHQAKQMAKDAAVAVAAALSVTEPASTGIGGDMFALFFDARTRTVHAINGSGRSPRHTTLKGIRADLNIPKAVSGNIPMRSAHAVTVPGAAAGWIDSVEAFGSKKLSMKQILRSAVQLCEEGFPVSDISAWLWKDAEYHLKNACTNNQTVLKTDDSSKLLRAPKAGEVFFSPELAKTLQILAEEGKKSFYTGPIAEAIVEAAQSGGGRLELSDLEEHLKTGSEFTKPVSSLFQGQKSYGSNRPSLELWEHAPNGQGIVVLMALSLLEEFEKAEKIPKFETRDHNTAPYLHALIECLSIAFADAHWWISDPGHSRLDARTLLSKPYLAKRAQMFDCARAGSHSHGWPDSTPRMKSCDTVYLAVTDRDGNAMSMVNSLYGHFGSCIVPAEYGFALQARGAAFDLGPKDHPNVYKGGKRPYHTIIPALITEGHADHRELTAVLGVMGGSMQPQGQVQVFMNLEVFMMNPQEALDAPRFCLSNDGTGRVIFLEEGIPADCAEELRKMGHNVQFLEDWNRSTFGRGQVVKRHLDGASRTVVYSAGSDPRGDGCAMPCM